MAIFSKYASSKIDASKRRVTALWRRRAHRTHRWIAPDGNCRHGRDLYALGLLSILCRPLCPIESHRRNMEDRGRKYPHHFGTRMRIWSVPRPAQQKHRSHASSRRFAAVHQTPLSLAPSFRRRQHDAAQCPNLHGSRVRKHGRRRLR